MVKICVDVRLAQRQLAGNQPSQVTGEEVAEAAENAAPPLLFLGLPELFASGGPRPRSKSGDIDYERRETMAATASVTDIRALTPATLNRTSVFQYFPKTMILATCVSLPLFPNGASTSQNCLCLGEIPYRLWEESEDQTLEPIYPKQPSQFLSKGKRGR